MSQIQRVPSIDIEIKVLLSNLFRDILDFGYDPTNEYNFLLVAKSTRIATVL